MGLFEKRIPRIPRKEQLQNFLLSYRPNNDEINLNVLLKGNFCAIQYSQVQLYIGEMIGKDKDGLGIFITPRLCFQGSWKKNQRVNGIEITKNGIYKGSYKNNKKEGQGEFHRHAGDIYVGEWKGGKKHGIGLWINSSGESYSGRWQEGKAEGAGSLNLRGSFNDIQIGSTKGVLLILGKRGLDVKSFLMGIYLKVFLKTIFPTVKVFITGKTELCMRESLDKVCVRVLES